MNTDERCFHQEAVGMLSFIAAAAQYQADVVRIALAVGLPKQQILQLRAWCPHLLKTARRVVCSLGGIRDDSGPLRDYFRDSPEWETNISILLTSEWQRCNASGHR